MSWLVSSGGLGGAGSAIWTRLDERERADEEGRSSSSHLVTARPDMSSDAPHQPRQGTAALQDEPHPDAPAAKRPRLDLTSNSSSRDHARPPLPGAHSSLAPPPVPPQAATLTSAPPHSALPPPSPPRAPRPGYAHRFTLEGHKKSISSVKFSQDGKWLVTAGASLLPPPLCPANNLAR